MPTERYSKTQARAVASFGSDVCVRAGAGSGKTSVLVGRYAEAVLRRGATPERILAITFTDRAANEMKSRLVREFTEYGREDLRRALENAYIGTIHGFCQRFLRENPVEAGVDPYFKVLSEGESEILMAKAIDAVFEAQADRRTWLNILIERGERQVRAAILSLYAQFRSAGEDESLLAVKDGIGRRELESRISRDLLNMAASFGPHPKKTEEAILEASRRIPEAFSEPLTRDSAARVRDAAKAVQKRMHAEWVKAFHQDVARWFSAALQDVFFEDKREFARIFRLFREAYEAEKRRRAVLDFDDLPILAWKTLSGDTLEKRAVRERYRAKFLHVFVDEFQDTSPLQARLIDRLRGDGNLFVVGDPQQSIYAFRHADPALFARYEAEAPERIELSENYRSRREILDFINGFFCGEGSPFRALYAKKTFASAEPDAVEAQCVFYGESETAKDLDEAREAEAALIASRLASLAGSGRFRWGEMAILMRSTTKAPLYERALARAGVPFYSVKSRGFFERPEVKDFIAYLTLLDHPEDDVSLAAVLRSPLVGISDDGLFWLARHAKSRDADTPLAAALADLGAVPNLSEPERSKAGAFAAFADEVRARRSRSAVSALLEEAARRSGYECSVLALPSGTQALANVRKLVEMARSLEEKTPVDAAEFVRYVHGLAEREDAEAEARVQGEGGDVVLLASVHAAKGLEFPCVVLANLGGQAPQGRSVVAAASPEEGLGWSAPVGDDAKASPDRAYDAAMRTMKRKAEEEGDRVFYVAATRAKEKLILSGAARRRSEGDETTWMTRVIAFFGGRLPAAIPESSGFRRPLPSRPDESAVTAESIAERLTLPVKPYDVALDVTVTSLLAAYESGMEPDYSEEPEAVEPEDAERSPRNEYGTLYHKAMEVMTRRSPRGVAGEEFLEDLFSPLTQDERREMRGQIDAFWAGPLGSEVKAAKECYPELPFIYKTPHGILKGQIDLAYRAPDGRWTILDYKTNLLAADGVDAVARSYEFQLALYALVFRNLMDEVPARGVLWFASPGVSRQFVYDPGVLAAAEARMSEVHKRLVLETA